MKVLKVAFLILLFFYILYYGFKVGYNPMEYQHTGLTQQELKAIKLHTDSVAQWARETMNSRK